MTETYPVTYYCPHCGAVVELQREGYLADRSVTPYPLAGWEYEPPHGPFEEADGVALTCGESEAPRLEWTGERSPADDVADPGREAPCGERFYLSFVRFEDGEQVEPEPDGEYVTIGAGSFVPRGPRGPDTGPAGR